MKIKAKRSIIVLFTLIFAISVFAVTAFATDTSGNITPGDAAAEPSAQVSSNEPSAPSSSETQSAPADSSSSEDTGSSGAESTVPDSSLVPSSSEAHVSSQAPASSRYVSSAKPTQSVDTQNSRVEAIASQAEAAVSDPDVLSSQDWSELLSSGSDSAVQAGGTISGIESAASTPTGQGGGVSWLLILGIAFIVLGIGGIGFFVYSQFLSHRRGGPGGSDGPIDISSRSVKSADPIDDTVPMEFEDISSDSDGTQHRGGYVPDVEKSFDNIRPAGTVSRAPSAPAEKPQPKKPEVSAKDVTAPIPQEILPQRGPAAPPREIEAKPISQATPVENGKNFDWEKFFNDDQ